MKSNTISTGLAMFSMFFGAGNVVFPLAMGQYAQDQNGLAVLGLLITAVGVPFIGLISMTLFDGNYSQFFSRIGKIPGFFVTLFIMGLLGPFGALPRVVALSYSTLKIFIPQIPLHYFSIASCLLIYLLTFKRSRLLDILGYFLTPILLLCLGALIVKGLVSQEILEPSQYSPLTNFVNGLQVGYNTMDLMGAFFFSSVVILCLKREASTEKKRDKSHLINMTLKASLIGALLLSVVYVGLSFLAAYHSDILTSVPKDELLAALALQILGNFGGIIAVVAVSLACLTTAMALALAFAEFVHKEISLTKLSYHLCLALTLVITFFMSTLNFSGIQNFLEPILIICYPALIVLSVINIFYKLTDFQPVIWPVVIIFFISLALYFM